MTSAPQPKKLCFQFSTQGNDYQDVMIRAYQHGWCPYTHVDLVGEDGRLLGARMDGGVIWRNAGYAPFSEVKTVGLDVSPAAYEAFWIFLQGQIGKPYDTTAIALMALPPLFVAIKGAQVASESRSPTEEDSWFCSELAVAALIAGGVVPTLPALAKVFTPADALLVTIVLGGK